MKRGKTYDDRFKVRMAAAEPMKKEMVEGENGKLSIRRQCELLALNRSSLYYERQAFGRHTDALRLFLYKVTRNLMKLRGDSGAYLRTTMGAMVLFGVPPESYWPYTDKEESFDREPSAFCYAFAQNYQTIKYFRHDPAGAKPADVSTA